MLGGAIARIAAVHVADEGRKLSIRQGLAFAKSKFLSFLSAPIIPSVIIIGIGIICAAVGGLFFLIHLELVVGLLYFLALAAGFVTTLVLLGMAGGFNLMYPAIAVEGSDSFDAISRSFSYVYSKPWRTLFYSLVAIGYGLLTYLFVRVFISLVLLTTHFFVGLLVFRDTAAGTDLWNALVPLGSMGSLRYQVDYPMLSTYGDPVATILAFWNYLLIATLGAFAISMYFVQHDHLLSAAEGRRRHRDG